jgi:hypothetical protein
MAFIVSLLAAPAVTDDRVVFANRASSNEDSGTSHGPIGHRVVFPDGKWDNENRRPRGLCSGVTRQDLTEAESLTSSRKISPGKNSASQSGSGVRNSAISQLSA